MVNVLLDVNVMNNGGVRGDEGDEETMKGR